MFNKKAKPSNQAPQAKPAAPSIVSADLNVNGNLHSTGDIQIDGTVEGDIQSGKLTISGSAVVRGAIEADSVVIAGQVTGQIKARHVTLMKSAKVIADVIQERLSIEPGAFFEGNCRHFPEEKPSKGAPVKLENLATGIPTPKPLEKTEPAGVAVQAGE